MALTIMNNPTAIGAMGKLNSANSALSKTIGQLSSGLRINSAADDASGLAVSEKLRGQIKGLGKAASNAQDAISLLQTAEASMGSMTDIIQRMRELAVQAGDPAYTTNDRAMLQLEVDQLKSEVDRISTSTEFNTKKLLNGDAAGVWSSSSANLEAILKGSPAEGNYKIESFAAGGQNEVQKSQVMKTRDGVQVIGAIDFNKAAGIVAINGVRGMMADDKTNSAIGFEVRAAAAAAVNNDRVGHNKLAMTMTSVTTISAGKSGYVEFHTLAGGLSAGGTIQARFIDARTGLQGEWMNVKLGTTGQVSGAVTLAAGIRITAGTSLGLSAANTSSAGGTALFAVNGAITANTATTTANIHVNTNFATTGTVTVSAGYTMQVSGLVSNGGDMKHTFYTGQIDTATGTVYYGSMDITFEKSNAVSLTERLTAAATNGLRMTSSKDQSPASRWTTLSELSNFTNSDGRNVLANNQELTIYGGNGKQATIYLEGSDTIQDMEDKLTAAIVDQLGLGGSDLVNENLVNFVNSPLANSNEAVKGTFVIQGATVGSNSKMSFVGDQNVLNALGLSILQSSKDSETTIKVSDAHSGAVIGQDKVSDDILRGVIKGVDVKVNPSGDNAIIASFGADRRMTFTPATAGSEAFLHIKANPTKAAIGANEGQTLDISIGRVDTVALGIDSVVVATFDDAQSSISKLDLALETLSKSRATAGAQMNRLDYTINNLNTMKENLTSAESRLRDLDMAQASSDLTAQQVRLQAATAMLAQANQMPSYAAQLLQ